MLFRSCHYPGIPCTPDSASPSSQDVPRHRSPKLLFFPFPLPLLPPKALSGSGHPARAERSMPFLIGAACRSCLAQHAALALAAPPRRQGRGFSRAFGYFLSLSRMEGFCHGHSTAQDIFNPSGVPWLHTLNKDILPYSTVHGNHFPRLSYIRNCRKITDATCLEESLEIQGKRLSTRISYL